MRGRHIRVWLVLGLGFSAFLPVLAVKITGADDVQISPIKIASHLTQGPQVTATGVLKKTVTLPFRALGSLISANNHDTVKLDQAPILVCLFLACLGLAYVTELSALIFRLPRVYDGIALAGGWIAFGLIPHLTPEIRSLVFAQGGVGILSLKHSAGYLLKADRGVGMYFFVFILTANFILRRANKRSDR